MKLIFLGTGTAFTVGEQNFQSNALLEVDGKYLLIDCGGDVRHALFEKNLTYKDIDAVYISHLHADHVGGLEWLAMMNRSDLDCKKPYLFLSDCLVDPLWDHVLKGGLYNKFEKPASILHTYFDVCSIKANCSFLWCGIEFWLVQTVHALVDCFIMPSFGLFARCNNFQIFITTDTQLAPNQIKHFYKKADLIFQDCETKDQHSGIHAHYQDLAKLDPAIKKKMWLYHYSSACMPDAAADGFKGFIKKGQEFNLAL